MTYEQAMKWLKSPDSSGSKLGLSRTCELLERLGDPQRRLHIIHVAGTNGKGSVSCCVAAILKQAGYKTGLYTSPYLTEITESVCINGTSIGRREFAELIGRIQTHCAGMADHPTEFEIMTALALLCFAEQDCDFVVLEVGLGGRLDATNVIDVPEVAVITRLGLDHVRELGDSLDKITCEKAGIIKPGGQVVTDGRNQEVLGLLQDICRLRACELTVSKPDQLTITGTSLAGITFDYGPHQGLSLPLAGLYQPGNAVLAIEVIRILQAKGYEISGSSIRAGLAGVCWPGRFEVLCEAPVFILDGSHNLDGLQVTVQSLQHYFPERKIRFILGILMKRSKKQSPAQWILLAAVMLSVPLVRYTR